MPRFSRARSSTQLRLRWRERYSRPEQPSSDHSGTGQDLALVPNGSAPLDPIDNDRFDQARRFDLADEMAELESGRTFYDRRS